MGCAFPLIDETLTTDAIGHKKLACILGESVPNTSDQTP